MKTSTSMRWLAGLAVLGIIGSRFWLWPVVDRLYPPEPTERTEHLWHQVKATNERYGFDVEFASFAEWWNIEVRPHASRRLGATRKAERSALERLYAQANSDLCKVLHAEEQRLWDVQREMVRRGSSVAPHVPVSHSLCSGGERRQSR